METLLEGIEENRLDALYLFITDVLRDDTTFRRYFANLVSVLPNNFSVHRIEVGHEFLKHVNKQARNRTRHRIPPPPVPRVANAANAPANVEDDSRLYGDPNDPHHPQRILFQAMTDLESLRTMIVSDGYVQRKDHGAICTRIFLQELPRARSLVNLDVHRLELANVEQVTLLADACEALQDSLEDLRLTGIFFTGINPTSKNKSNSTNNNATSGTSLTLDPVVETLIDMPHLKTLALSLYPGAHSTTPNDYHFVSPDNLRELCQLSTLQDLTLRNLHLNDQSIEAMSEACESNSFLTTLDLRQNIKITKSGYNIMLSALNRNFASWCTVLVDDIHYQGRFNVLIELNQADRGHLVQNFTKSKFIHFLEKVDNPSAIWYFLQLHDTVRTPLTDYLLWQAQHEKRGLLCRQQQQQAATAAATAAAACAIVTQEEEESDKVIMGNTNDDGNRKRKAITIEAA